MFITFEGGEGSGKSSIVNNLKKLLPDFIFVNDPSSQTKELSSIRNLLLDPEYHFCDKAEFALYIAARSELVHQLIKPSIDKGLHVISDRFVDSTMVYQVLLKNNSIDILNESHDYFCDWLWPDLTFLCDVDPKIGLTRSNKRLNENNINENRWENMELNTHIEINNGYLGIAKHDPDRFCILNSNYTTIGQMTQEALTIINQRINNKDK